MIRSCLFLFCFLAGALLEANPVLNIDASKAKGAVSPTLYGLMTEEIHHSYDGGLYAELVQNRMFRDDAAKPVHWAAVCGAGEKCGLSLDAGQPIEGTVLHTSLKLDATGCAPGHRVGVANDGFWGIPVKPATTYRLSFYAKSDAGAPLTASIESNDGAKTFATAQIPALTDKWQKYTATLTTGADVVPGLANRLVLSGTKPGNYWFNLVSLFPPTFNDRPNGNRIDLMQILGDMKPTFLRFPGGNFLEGNVTEERFKWKETIGPLEQRPGHPGCWKYGASDGMGLLEFMEWCEDLHIEPLPAVYDGFSFNGFTYKGVLTQPGATLQPFVDEAMEELEYLTGDASTKWGAERIKDGHAAPFVLHFVEIGNEDGFDHSGSHDARFTQFYDAIHARYPELKIIASCGGKDWLGPQAPVKSRVPYAFDEHYYKQSWEMYLEASRYDTYDRKGPRIFVGEWASCDAPPFSNALQNALGDAAFLTGMERNSDLVTLSCCAPLMANINDAGRAPVRYDGLTSFGSPSYHAQKMFATYLGDSILAVTGENMPTWPMQRPTPEAKAGVPPPKAPPVLHLPTLFYVATKDDKSGTIYLKVVNVGGTPQAIDIRLNGAGTIAPEGKLICLTSAKPSDGNTIKEPTKVVPVTTAVAGLGAAFTQTFAPYSINVLQIETSAPR